MTERFKKPTEQQLFDFAVLVNEGHIDIPKLTDMMALVEMVVDRLYENGDIMVPSAQEMIDEAMDSPEE